MIRLEKRDEPEILARRGAEWTASLLASRDEDGRAPSVERQRYNHPQIKEALIAETNGKCAYCESKIRHVAYGDIEHVVAKSLSPERSFDWRNLTLACSVCNTNKGNYGVDSENFVDPYAVDPEEAFWWFGAVVFPAPGNDAAALTERIIDLNRTELQERRAERLANLMALLEVIQRVRNNRLKRLLWDDFLVETGSDREYAALARSTARLAGERLSLEPA